MSKKNFIKISIDADELLVYDPESFLFMSYLAFKVFKKPSIHSLIGDGDGEVYINRTEIRNAFGWSERLYRNIKARVEEKYRLATFVGTSNGTIVKLVDNRFCINVPQSS